MYGTKAKELLLEMRRAEGVPAYNKEDVRAAVAESQALAEEVFDLNIRLGLEDLSSRSAVNVHMHAARRNYQCLLAYHHARLTRLEEVRWRTGAVLPADVAGALHARETDYFRAYSQAVTGYMADTGLDLAADMAPPQRNLRRVRALRDCGELMTAAGPRALFKGQEALMHGSDAEPLVRKGWLEDTVGADMVT